MPSRTDTIRAAFMSIITSTLSVLILGGVVSWSAELVAAVTLLVNNVTLFAALLIPAGGTPSTAQGATKI